MGVLLGLKALRVLNLGFNDIADAVLVHLNGASCPLIIFYLCFILNMYKVEVFDVY